jgi:protein-tyrosine phosphatase
MAGLDEWSFMITNPADRFLRLGGSRNFRHMGGYSAAGGRVTRADRLFRSGWFDLGDEEQARRFDDLEIRQVFDLRTDLERERQPLRLNSSSVDLIGLPITSGSMGAYLDSVSGLVPSEVDCRSAMVRMYREMPEQGGPALARLFKTLSDGEGGALIVCATGKDRTGLASALLLTALGVSPGDVLADYMVSADVYRGHEEEFARQHNYEQRTGHDLGLFRDVFTVHPEYLHAVADGELGRLVDELVTVPMRLSLADRFTG